jgi:hypothetical protein
VLTVLLSVWPLTWTWHMNRSRDLGPRFVLLRSTLTVTSTPQVFHAAKSQTSCIVHGHWGRSSAKRATPRARSP